MKGLIFGTNDCLNCNGHGFLKICPHCDNGRRKGVLWGTNECGYCYGKSTLKMKSNESYISDSNSNKSSNKEKCFYCDGTKGQNRETSYGTTVWVDCNYCYGSGYK